MDQKIGENGNFSRQSRSRWLRSTAKKKVAIHRYTAFFSCNADIPKYSYTTSYTVICKDMTFLWLSYTNQIPSPEFTELYTAFDFFLQIPNTYRLLWRISDLYHSLNNNDLSQLTWIVILFKKLHNIIWYTVCIPAMWSLYNIFLAKSMILNKIVIYAGCIDSIYNITCSIEH